MPVKVTVPSFGESITEVAIETWLKAEGDRVELDEPIVNIDSDKATLELPAPASGVLTKILAREGDFVEIGAVIAEIEEGAVARDEGAAETKAAAKDKGAEKPAAPAPQPASEAAPPSAAKPASPEPQADAPASEPPPPAGPAARRLMAQHGMTRSVVKATGFKGRILKEDVEAEAARRAEREAKAVKQPGRKAPQSRPPAAPTSEERTDAKPTARRAREEQTTPMSPIRRIIARRLVEATQTTAMLTTFNEVDMSRIKGLRSAYQDAFRSRYDIKLGFMAFFMKAVIEALKAFPSVNAEVRDTDIVYRNYYDIGVAVGGGKGLTVPVIRDADTLSFAEIERTIADFAVRARENRLSLDELKGGTFTISNGGIYGSLLSTPILNPPQSGILGMHKIEDRPVAIDGEVVVRPMMYLALTYDHRIVDGREAVQFLIKVKECVESPERILLEV